MSRADLYERLEKLGEGGQGRTWKARDTRTGELVAVKEMLLTEAEGWDAVRRFERECEVLEALDHPGIPAYLDHYVDEEEGRYGLVMELVDGRPLSDRAEALSEDDLTLLAYRVLDILEYLHSRRPPVIHRDIKPANLVSDGDHGIKLVDFGGVKEVSGASQSGTSAFGTYGYMAPEQYRGQALPTSDLYGLGATLLSLSTGKPPEELPDKPVLGGRVPKVATLMPAGALRDTIEALMAPGPEDRPASAARARDWLAHGKVSTRPFSQPGRLVAVAAVFVALMALGGAFAMISGRTKPPAQVAPRVQVASPPAAPKPAPPLPIAPPPTDPASVRYLSPSTALAAGARRSLEIAGAAQLSDDTPAHIVDDLQMERRTLSLGLNKAADRRLQLLHLQACEGGLKQACRLVNMPGWSCAVSPDAQVHCVTGSTTPKP